MKYMVERVREYINRKTVRARMRKAISILCCVVVFVTTYALILPSLALEKTVICGKEEHEHTADCYTRELVCGQEESEAHQHTDECYEDVLTCGKEVHVHTLDCYEAEEPEEEEPAQEPEEPAVEETAQEPAAEETDEPEETAAPEETVEEEEEEEQETPAVEEPQEQEPEDDPVEEQVEEKSDSGKTEKADKADTSKEEKKKEEVAEPEKLGKIDFADLLTNDTDVFYLPENAGSDDWEAIDGNVKLDPEETVILHIAYEIPAGELNATNTETEYYLPIEIAMSDKEVEAVNKYQSTVFDGTDRKSDDLKKAGEFEIEEKTNDKGEVTERKLVIRFNDYAAGKVGGEKLTDGTVTAKPEKIEGFLELSVSAADLLTLEKVDDAAYKLEWNDDDRLNTTVHFDEEKLAAFENQDKEETADETAKKDEKEQSEKKQPEKKVVIQEIEEEKPAETEAPAQEQTEETAKTEEAAEEVKYASGRLKYDGGSYTVTADFDESAKLPEGVQLKATELQGATYDMYLNKAQDAVDEGKEVTGARFFDITFVNTNGEPVEPQGMVDIKIQYKNSETIEKDANVEGLHFTEEGAENVDVETKGIADNHVDVVTFQSDSFSVYGILYTVDFEIVNPETGKVYTYSLQGGKSINLTELLVILGIKSEDEVEKFVAEEVTDVKFSDPELVRVTHKGKFLGLFGKEDWLIESLQPFNTEETLAIVLKDGRQITVKVTDAQDTTSPWNLANTDNTQFLHVTAESSVTETELNRNAAFKLNFSYSLEEDVVRAIDNYDGDPVLIYDLTSVANDYPVEISNFSNGVISIGTRRLGNYIVRDGKAILTFTDHSYFDGRTSFSGYFSVTFQTDETRVNDEGRYNFEFPGTTDIIPIRYKQKVESGGKQLQVEPDADGNYTLHYTAKIDVTSDLDSLTFNDTIGGLQTLDPSSVKIAGNSVSVTQTGNRFTFDVARALGTTGVAKGSYQVTYDTKLTAEQLKNMTADKTTETNAVSWKVNGSKDVDGGKTTHEFKKPQEPIPVVKTISDTASQPGDYVDYTITFGKDTTALSGFHISDVMTDVVIPQGKVTLTYNGQTTQIDFGAQAADSSYSKGSVTLFDYTFPEGTAGNGPVTATYRVKLIDADTAKANGVYDTTEVNNIATEHRQNTNDTKKTTVNYEKEPVYTVTKTETSNKTDDGKWAPGTEIHYTLTIGDANTNMAGVNIRDVMTDLQTLQDYVMIQVGNGSTMRLTEYVADAMKWVDDGNYSTNDVELFNFNMPSNAGNGPVVITYTTKVITQDQATAASIYGDKTIKNTGSGGKQSDGTTGIGEFEEFPVTKTVTQDGVNVDKQTVEMNSFVHYTLTYGKAGMNMGGAVIEDQMTDLQKLVGDIIVRKSDGTSFIMPIGSGQWSEDGNNWAFWDDGKYSSGTRICLFKYRLPADIGEGPITIEYNTQIISEDEAKESGINGTQSAFNKFINPETEVKIEFPKEVTHNPQVRKEFDHWDVENSKVYWNIIVEKDAESAYPLENVTVRESWDRNEVSITEPNQGYNGYNHFDGSNFDVTHAVVTTDDGTVLTPGIDYTIDENQSMFLFPVLNERVHINLAFLSPAKIIDGYKMENRVRLNNDKEANKEQTYNHPEIEAMKNGHYDEDTRILTWEVQINPNSKTFSDSNPPVVMFEDTIPKGLDLVNFDDPSNTDEPTIKVVFGYKGTYYVGTTPAVVGHYISYAEDVLHIEENESGTIISSDIAPSQKDWQGNPSKYAGLSGNKVVVTYKTKLSDKEWDAITSSASGSEVFENHVDITAGNDEHFKATDQVTVTTDEYLNKTDSTKEKDGGNLVIDENGDNSKNITYRVEINPHGYKLNNDDPLSLTDYISTNMDLNPESVKVFNAHMGEDGKLVQEDETSAKLSISYNDDARLLSITNIPDKTPFILTYTCYARAQGEDEFRNTATLIGGGSHSSTVTKKHTIQTNDAGVKVDGISLNMFKIDENNISKKLAGAKFQLYECELDIGEMTNPEVYSRSYWEALLNKMDRITAGGGSEAEIEEIKEQFKIVNYKPIGVPVVTGGSGYTQWTGLNEHKLYAWEEVEAPNNYTGYEGYHYFVGYQHIDVNSDSIPQPLLPADEQLARKHAAWALDDAVQLANDIRVASMANLTTWTATNVETKYTSISATKEWENDSDNLFQTRPSGGIKLQLWQIKDDGSKVAYGSPVAINADDEGNWPTYIWNKLPANDAENEHFKYTVTEQRIDNYTTSYSDNGDGVDKGEIVVTNRMIPKTTDIHVKKVFDQDEADNKPDSIKVTLMVIKTDKEGNAGEPEETSLVTYLSDSNEWKWTFANLPTTTIEEGADGTKIPYTLSYTVVEDLADLESKGFKYTVTYSDNGEGVLETTEEEPLLITNRAPRNGSLKINKKVTVNGQTPTSDTYSLVNGKYSFTITKKDDTEFETRTVELTIYGNSLAESEEITDLPAGTYVITETPVTGTELIGATVDGAAATISSNSVEVEVVAGKVAEESPVVEFTNNATKIDFEKVWKNGGNTIKWPENTSITVRVIGGDKAYEYEYTISRSDLTEGKVIDGKAESDPKLTVKVVKEDDTAKQYTYKFEVNGLPYNNGVAYKVIEEKVDEFKDPIYRLGTAPSEGGAQDGGTIENIAEESYNLPSTGGIGTTLFTILGSILSIFAAAMLYMRRQRLMTVKAAANKRNNKHTSRRGGGGLL